MVGVEKLLAAIEEAERLALSASPGPWRTNAEHDEVYAVDDIPVCETFALSGNQLRATATFIAHNDPAAVLRFCAADHRVLERHSHYTRSGNAPDYELTCRHCSSEWPCEDLVDLADRYGISVEEETTGE